MSLSEKLKSIFNRLLATLVILDNCFIALSLINTIRIHFFPEHDIFHVVGNSMLFPMRSTFLYCTIYVAIALAVERYRAIRSVCMLRAITIAGLCVDRS